MEAKGCRPLSANPLAHLQPARRLGVVEVDGKRIPRRRNSDLHQDPPDLAAVIAAMRDDMCQHFWRDIIALSPSVKVKGTGSDMSFGETASI